jgi:hypothetical protein
VLAQPHGLASSETKRFEHSSLGALRCTARIRVSSLFLGTADRQVDVGVVTFIVGDVAVVLLGDDALQPRTNRNWAMWSIWRLFGECYVHKVAKL